MKKVLWGILLLVGGLFGFTHAKGEEPFFVNLVKINDYVINPVVSEYISSAIKTSQEQGAQCLVIELDTPGGLLATTRNIVKDIMNADIPVVVYVAPSGARAGSAGVFITLASHVAAMAPSTNIGAAHPVHLGGPPPSENQNGIQKILEQFIPSEKTSSPMEDKILNDTVAWVRGIAHQRGRNEQWAVQSVTKSLSSDADEALKEGVIEFICKDVDELLTLIDGKEVQLPNRVVRLQTKNGIVREIPMTKRQLILNVLSNPNIAYILMMLGFYGLLYEITHPGFGVPGIAGVICLVLAFYALQTLPVNYAGLILILLAIALFIAEALVTSFGLFALGGVIAMFLGSLMLFDSTASFMRVSLKYILPVVFTTAGLTIFLVTLVVRAQRKKVSTGMEGLIGEVGTVETDLEPGKEGTIYVHGEIWGAVSDSDVKSGEKVKVVFVQGMKLGVKKL